nr:bifunctional hydroxymethylpyrimidine kinase/phosphomethylpyrimidine kinase [uncultured Blautia sp.]
MKTVLTIAGSDCSGGAGIQADIKTMIMNGVYAMSVITALTAQNTTGVFGIQETPVEFVDQQMDCVFQDIFPDAVKIGMLSSPEIMHHVAAGLQKYEARHIVLDPVMVSTSGHRLMQKEAEETLQKELFPLAEVITPNIPEAEVLTGLKITDADSMELAAKAISNEFHISVLLKGGHRVEDANDLLYTDGKTQWLKGERIDNPNTHGTGCTLSSAIASNLAKGYDLTDSVVRAKSYLTDALRADLNLGKGSGPLDHSLGDYAKKFFY